MTPKTTSEQVAASTIPIDHASSGNGLVAGAIAAAVLTGVTP
jgi:ribosomal protein S5